MKAQEAQKLEEVDGQILVGPSWTTTTSGRQGSFSLSQEHMVPGAAYRLEGFVMGIKGEERFASCDVSQGRGTLAQIGWLLPTGCSAIRFGREMAGKELRVDVTALKDGVAVGTYRRYLFVWSPARCLLTGEFEPFTQATAQCGAGDDKPTFELKKGIPEEISFGVEYELISREKDGADKGTDEAARTKRREAVTKCWNASIESNEALKKWDFIEDASVLSVNEMDVVVHGTRFVEDEVLNLYREELDPAEKSGLGVEVVSPILKGSAGVEELAAALRALRRLGVSANPTGGLHVHMNALNEEIGGPTLTAAQYTSVLLGWVENQLAVNRMQRCSRLVKPYATPLYASQQPVADWFPLLHADLKENPEMASATGTKAQRLLRFALRPYLRTAMEISPELRRKDAKVPLSSDIYHSIKDAIRPGWRKDNGLWSNYRPSFNYEATVGIIMPKEEQSAYHLVWEKVHGSIEFRQHAGTASEEDSLRWIQFLSAFVYHYKQPAQVERIFDTYLRGDPVEDHERLIRAQNLRGLDALMSDLRGLVEDDSFEYYSAQCECREKPLPSAGRGIREVVYDPEDEKVFSTLQLASQTLGAGSWPGETPE